jgi:hypothetical protein
MQEQLLFEYAVIRIVPQVEREEFINVGVVLYCASRKFLKVISHIDATRIKIFAPSLDTEDIGGYLKSFEKICAGGNAAGPIACQGVAERFRWLTAIRSTVVQTSRVHPGFCTDPEARLETLFKELVG